MRIQSTCRDTLIGTKQGAYIWAEASAKNIPRIRKKAINIELEQLQRMGTWKLVDKPPDAVPIANK